MQNFIWGIAAVLSLIVGVLLGTEIYQYIGSEHWLTKGGGRLVADLQVWELSFMIIGYGLMSSVIGRKL